MNKKFIENSGARSACRQFLNDSDITHLLGISQRTLNNKICRGDDLPEFIKLRGCRRRIWPFEAVQIWLDSPEDGANK